MFPQIPTTKPELVKALKASELNNKSNWKLSQHFFIEAPIASLQVALINRTNVLNQSVSVDEIEQLKWDGNWSDHTTNPYERFQNWVGEKIMEGNTYYYSRGREDFFAGEGYKLAAEAGKKFIILEDLS